MSTPTSLVFLGLNKTKPVGGSEPNKATLAGSRTERPINVGLCVETHLGALTEIQPPAQPHSMSSFYPNRENEKMVCEFRFHSVKIRTEKIHLCKSVFFQLLFAHILYNYGQQEGIFRTHTGSIFHTKVYAGGQPALELFTCVVDRKPSDLWPVRPQQNVFILTSPVIRHIILISLHPSSSSLSKVIQYETTIFSQPTLWYTFHLTTNVHILKCFFLAFRS